MNNMTEPPRSKGTDEKYCADCGAIINVKAEICPKCGVRQMPAPMSAVLGRTAPSGRSKFIAGICALFLGGLGIHKFYLGQTVWGIVYLLFCWTFIPAIVSFFEAIYLLLMSQETFDRKFG